jgi:hypothetical protein
MYYNRTLRHLDIPCLLINQDGVNEIMTALRYHPSLQKLAVHYSGTEGIVGEISQFLKYNEVLKELELNYLDDDDTSPILYFPDHASVQSMLDYNDTIHLLPDYAMDEEDERFEFINGLFKQNRCIQRTAIKKGVSRRQDSYMWLYNSWISTCNNTTTPNVNVPVHYD